MISLVIKLLFLNELLYPSIVFLFFDILKNKDYYSTAFTYIMGKDRLYFLTFISILLIFLISASIGVKYSVKICVNLLVELEFEAGKKEAQKIAYLISNQTKFNQNDFLLINNIQDLLYEVEPGTTYLAVLNKNNVIICHPNITSIDGKLQISRLLENSVNNGLKLSEIHDILMEYKEKLHQNSPINSLEVLYEKPIKNTNLKVISVVNINQLLLRIIKLKRRLHTIFVLMGVLIITISFFTVRFIGSFYEKKLETKNLDLENDIISLTKLNLKVSMSQQKIESQESENMHMVSQETEMSNEHQKNRLLTYKGNELIPTLTKDIAYIYTENTVTYVVNKTMKKTISNASLDEVYSDLNTTLFFRANRQFIIHVTSIEKIIKYGKSQLKILIINSDSEIIISKNKVAEFKRWLNV